VNRNLRTLFCLTKQLSNPNYLPVYIKYNFLEELADCFVRSPTKIYGFSLLCSVTKIYILCTGEIEHEHRETKQTQRGKVKRRAKWILKKTGVNLCVREG
jgi:hypothetical protein